MSRRRLKHLVKGCVPNARIIRPRKTRAIARHAQILRSSGPSLALGISASASTSLDDKRSQRRWDFLPIWSCSVWGLPCPRHYCRGGALLPHLFTLTPPLPAGRYVFCGTFRRASAPRLAKALRHGCHHPPGRYPAHCSAEFGLSSPPILARAALVPCSHQNGRGGRPVRLPTETLYAMTAGLPTSGRRPQTSELAPDQ